MTPQDIYNIPGRYTAYWFDGNIPIWNDELAPYKYKPTNYLEIGVYEARSLVWMLKHILIHPESRATAVDGFIGGTDQEGFAEHIQDGKLFETFTSNIEPWKDRVTVKAGDSKEVLKHLKRGAYNVIYHDGSHEADDVYQDLKLAWPLLKKGGLLLIDDAVTWTWNYVPNSGKDPAVSDPIHGINKFLSEIEGKYEEVYRLHQLHIRKI